MGLSAWQIVPIVEATTVASTEVVFNIPILFCSVTEAAAIAGIKRGEWSFYVHAGGRTVGVIIATSRYGNEYLKTQADGEQPDNLLSLPECPP